VIGFLTYSEGCNDDVNKAVWSGVGWSPEAHVDDILREYSRFFIGDTMADGFAQGLLALERNWRGPLLGNTGVDQTLKQFQQLERNATPQDLQNWRFQQALYRAYYDAYVRSRLVQETAAESRAIAHLRDARRVGSAVAMNAAEGEFDRAAGSGAADLRARVFELAEALYQSIRMQLGVSRYKAMAGRGNNLDTIDAPLNNRLWWRRLFEGVRAGGDEPQRVKAIDGFLDWENSGPGGFYDSLGDPSRSPHLVRGQGYQRDPDFLFSPRTGFRPQPDAPLAWMRFAETQYETPLQMRYTGLDKSARYKVRIVMSGEAVSGASPISLRLRANEQIVIHDYTKKPVPIRPLEFDIPAEATAGGELRLSWDLQAGAGGPGRGCQMSEVWLIRQ
ncbi:MAG: hypothetical protein ABIZ80_20210, partial [Bryobacteraceae bacterium]